MRQAHGSDPWLDTIACPRCKKETPRRLERCQGCGFSIRETRAYELEPRVERDTMIGRVINDKYRVVSVLGEGGFGVVYKVEFLLFDSSNTFALKLLHPTLSQDPKFRRRFLREAALAMQLIHENTIQIREFGRTEDGILFFTMDYCEGEPLNVVLAREQFLSVNRALGISLQILSVMAQAHSRGIMHRDLKPENVFLERLASSATGRVKRFERCRDFVKVGDFGLAKSYRDSASVTDITYGGIIGTPRYMSPEQARGCEDLDHRSDLYSIGVMLHEMLFGQVPDDRPLVGSDGDGSYRPPVEPPQVVPRAVLEILERALAPRREDRFQSAEEFANAIRALPDYTPSYEEPRPVRLVKRGRARSIATVAGVGGLLVGAFVSAGLLHDKWLGESATVALGGGRGTGGQQVERSRIASSEEAAANVAEWIERRVSHYVPLVPGRQFTYDVFDTSIATSGAVSDEPTARLTYVVVEQPAPGIFAVNVTSEARGGGESTVERRGIRWIIDEAANAFYQEFDLPGSDASDQPRTTSRRERFRLPLRQQANADAYYGNMKVHARRYAVRGVPNCLVVEKIESRQRRLQYYHELHGLVALEVYELSASQASALEDRLAERRARRLIPTVARREEAAPALSSPEGGTSATPPTIAPPPAREDGWTAEPDPVYAGLFLKPGLENPGRRVYARYLTIPPAAPPEDAQ